ncbi:MAG: hypothetical protein BAA01_04910 [Bacillus thermozeamaize]|uniref:Regulatory protein YycH-like domain-containing protein n=1 Tax=Bacillus thermozeamaize TaxID=230954 RepID=A0A1Y3PKM1_9BACI|nr:MAG: hypothetical protein BAA01_04910 [Bacillus thermozeamaize]
MDWSRAKSILIVAFLILDLLLIWELVERQSILEEGFAAAKQELEQQLRQKRIDVKTEVPVEIPDGWVLTVQFREVTPPETQAFRRFPSERQPNQWAVQLLEPYPLVREISPRSDGLPELPADLIWKARQYQPDPLLSTAGLWRYVQMAEDVPMFNVGLEVEVKAGKVTGYRQSWVEIRKREKAPALIPAATAVYSLLENQYLPPRSALLEIRFGYYGRLYNADEQVLNPVWRVVFDQPEPGGKTSRKVLFVNAITGSLELDEPERRGLTGTESGTEFVADGTE